MKCGNMGRWFNSKSDIKAYVDSVMKSWADKKYYILNKLIKNRPPMVE